MTWLGEYPEDFTTVVCMFTTHDGNGAPVAPLTAFENADVRIYKNGSATEKTSQNGVTMTSPFDSITGLHCLVIDTSNDTGDSGFWTTGGGGLYTLVLSPDTETVNSQTVAKVIGQFGIALAPALRPTTAGRTLDVTSTGEAGIDWNNIGAPTTVVNLSGTSTKALEPATSGRTLVVDASGLADANVVKLGPTGSGTAQTARDIGASVLLSTGSGTGQLDFTSGVVKANLTQILGTVLTETSGLLAAGFKKFFNVATPTGTLNSIPGATAGAAGGLFIAGANAATTVDITGSLSGSVGSVSGAVGSVGGNVTGSVGSIATGGIAAASFAAGAINAAAIATDAIGAAELATDAVSEIAAGVWDLARSGHSTSGTFGEGVASVIGAVGSVTGAVGSVTGAVGSVTGAVGSVSGNVGGNVAGSVASVTAGVTVSTNNDKTGYALSTAGVQAIWDALTSALTAVGSIGKMLVTNLTGDIYARLGSPAGASVSADVAAVKAVLPVALVSGRIDASVGAMAAGVLTATAIAGDAITAAKIADGAIDAATFASGAITADAIAADAIGASELAADAVTEIQSGLSTLTAGGIRTAVGLATANLDTQIATLSTLTAAGVRSAVGLASADLDTQLATIAGYVDTEVAAIKAKTDNLPASPAATGAAMTLTTGERNSVADALLDRADAIETGLTLRQAIRGKVAMLFGVVTGGGTGSETFKNPAGDATRLTITDDSSGNRSAVTTNL